MTSFSLKLQNSALAQNTYLQVLIAVGLLFCSAHISIPLQPVPITLQSVAVMLIGLFYSRKQAVRSVVSYLLLGALGVPVFAKFGAGPAYFCGPTAGYLFGFLAAVAAMSFFREKFAKQTALNMLCSCLLGSGLIYACGVSWLACFIGFEKAIQVGLLPFIIPGCFKALLLSQAARFIVSKK